MLKGPQRFTHEGLMPQPLGDIADVDSVATT